MPTQVCCTQSPCPCGSPLLTRTSTGDTHSSLSGFMGTLEFALLVKKYFILVFCYIEVKKIFLTSCLFMTVLGLPWWGWVFWHCSEWGLFSRCGARASHWGGCAFCRAWALGLIGSVVVVHRLSCPVTWNLCGPGIEPMSRALAGRVLTTGPPGHWTTRKFRSFKFWWCQTYKSFSSWLHPPVLRLLD